MKYLFGQLRCDLLSPDDNWRVMHCGIIYDSRNTRRKTSRRASRISMPKFEMIACNNLVSTATLSLLVISNDRIVFRCGQRILYWDRTLLVVNSMSPLMMMDQNRIRIRSRSIRVLVFVFILSTYCTSGKTRLLNGWGWGLRWIFQLEYRRISRCVWWMTVQVYDSLQRWRIRKMFLSFCRRVMGRIG